MPIRRPLLALCTLALASLLTSGCFWAPGLAPLYRDLGPTHTGGAKESHFELRLGRLSMALAHALASADDDDEDAEQLSAILSAVHGVEISVTEFEQGANVADSDRFLKDVTRLAKRYHWNVGATLVDADSAAVVLYQGRRGTIQNVYLAVRESDSLVLARFRGNLDRQFFEVLARQGEGVKKMAGDHSDESAATQP